MDELLIKQPDIVLNITEVSRTIRINPDIFEIGQLREFKEADLDYSIEILCDNGVKCIAKLKSVEWIQDKSANIIKKCSCSLNKIMANGCNCGGI